MKIIHYIFIFQSIFISFCLNAQKNKDRDEKTIETTIQYHNKIYRGTYIGATTKVKSVNGKVDLPNGSGSFNGYLEGSEKKETLLNDQFQNSLKLSGKSSKSMLYNVNSSSTSDFKIQTAISMQRFTDNEGGAIIRLNFDSNNKDYLEFTLMEFKKESYNPATATIAEKALFNTAKTAFKNITVKGYISGALVDEKMKVFALDYTKFNTYTITKSGRMIDVIVNDISQGQIRLSKDLGLSNFTLGKDDSHDVEYDYIKFDQTKHDQKDAFSYSGNWEKGVFNGQGTLSYAGGEIIGVFIEGDINGEGRAIWPEFKYYGNMNKGVASGKGSIQTQNYSYTGQVENWSANGSGKMIFTENAIGGGKYNYFKGNFVNDQPMGSGTMTYNNKDSLSGTWNGYLFTGNGKLTLNDGSIYEGDWKNGKKDGKGKITYTDGNVLAGDFINDGFNGNGRIKLADGGIFEGTIINNKPSGNGTVSYPNGDKLTGLWNEQGFNGTGKRTYEQITNQEGKFCYEEGDWKNGKLNGKGKKVYQFKVNPEDTWMSVGTYTGDFVNGIFQGQGKLEYYNGTADLIVEGTWSNGQSTNGKVTTTYDEGDYTEIETYTGTLTGLGIANGSGTIKSFDGSVYVGQVSNGMPNGEGTLTKKNGQVEKGKFVNGEFKKPFQCKSTKIGNQTWMAENLNVTAFRNGDPILEVKSFVEWEKANNLRKPAFCYYDFDPSNGLRYGKLYNWFAVIDRRGIAPEGWHIPSKEEWSTLDNSLGGFDYSGRKCKTTSGWKNNVVKSKQGTNESGFSGAPSGALFINSFDYLENNAYYWSTTEGLKNSVYTNHVWIKQLGSETDKFLGDWRTMDYHPEGMSIRCIKD